MASCATLFLCQIPSSPQNPSFSIHIPSLFFVSSFPRTFSSTSSSSCSSKSFVSISASSSRALEALVFDCDGVILKSEHLHRQAYNDAFSHVNVICPSSSSSSSDPLNRSCDFYDDLQNRIGGGPFSIFFLFFSLFDYVLTWLLS
ncbi:hypothetical protein LguiB_031200 [Lonicera macranthoides]